MERDPEHRPAARATPAGLVALQLEYWYGASWYHDPARWETADGFAPYAVAALAHRALVSMWAGEALNAALGARIGGASADGFSSSRERLLATIRTG